MAPKMLIDATHAEETRVVVVNGTTLEDFDFEAASRRQLKGNIYLAKVTRVEPSLQAAFVDYGGNRHGFLAFSEIHPDYYQIPVADREALLAEQQAEIERQTNNGDADPPATGQSATNQEAAAASAGSNGDVDAAGNDPVETVSAEEEDEIRRRPSLHQRYRIQEVIKRRQIILVQVTKEERGTKGAALTTYISLAGRYCVLMANTTRGGGISRKIQSGEVRKRLRAMVAELNVPDGMAVILRTAGQERTKAEIKRDYDYLLRLWDSIREKTLQSTAPELIHEEANLIKRSIRDLYRSNFDEVLVEGDEGYRIAKDFMKMLMPSRAKAVQPYRDDTPLFHKFQIENQLDAMHSTTVQLRSGGYIVINLTEALVAIDVNSGRATRERNIEETATKTNLEAADEIARQLRLRDLAGLIVIDFIDMEDNRHSRAVEKRMKEAVRSDRARIQMGRISGFGLLELSRQRLRPSLLESSSEICLHCEGSGRVRSADSIALQALRAVEEEGIRGKAAEITITLPSAASMYLLNQKRNALASIERQYDLKVDVVFDENPGSTDHWMTITATRDPGARRAAATEQTAAAPDPVQPKPENANDGKRKRPRRRRRRDEDEAPATESVAAESVETADAASGEEDGETTKSRRRRGKRGGRRRSRARGAESATEQATAAVSDNAGDGPAPQPNAAGAEATSEPAAATANDEPEGDDSQSAARPNRGRRIRIRRRTEKADASADADAANAKTDSAPSKSAATDEPETKKPAPRRRRTSKPRATGAKTDGTATATPRNGGNNGSGGAAPPDPAPGAVPAAEDGESQPRRRGWWQRITGA